MSYEVLEKQIKALPDDAFTELSHYVEYLTMRYGWQKKEISITNKINDFFKQNPDSFNEFKNIEKSNLSSLRELTKNDTW